MNKFDFIYERLTVIEGKIDKLLSPCTCPQWYSEKDSMSDYEGESWNCPTHGRISIG